MVSSIFLPSISDSEFDPMGRKRRGNCHIAKITEDGILCKILSYLTMRDVVRTSVLSSRWRYLWEYAPNIIFDSENVLGIPYFRVEESNVETFISFLNEFLKHHQGTGVEKLLIDFPLNKTHAHHLNKWVNFGVASGAKDLCLILNEEYLHSLKVYGLLNVPTVPTEPYDFPCQLFACGRGSSIERLYLGYVALKLPANFDGFASLKAIDLVGVDVNECDIQNLMCSCPALESMGIRSSKVLTELSIYHPPSLKHLKVCSCMSLKKMDLSAENLTSFQYLGGRISFSFKNNPLLTSALFLLGFDSETIHYALGRLPIDLPQIESLSLLAYKKFEVHDLPVNSKKFTHLKQLVIAVRKFAADHLLWLATLLNAAPFVERFKLHLFNHPTEDEERREITRPSKCPYEHLKTVEITGFSGIASHIEIAAYLLSNSPRLEQMSINVSEHFHHPDHGWRVISRADLLEKIAERARHLHEEASTGTKLVFCATPST